MLTCNSVMESSHATVAQRITTPASSERGRPHRRKSTPEGEIISTTSLTRFSHAYCFAFSRCWLICKGIESDKSYLPATDLLRCSNRITH
jgi:hypothetical protein